MGSVTLGAGLDLSSGYQLAKGLGKTQHHLSVSPNPPSTASKRPTQSYKTILVSDWEEFDKGDSGHETKRKCQKYRGRMGVGVHKNYFCIRVPSWESPTLSLGPWLQCGPMIPAHPKRFMGARCSRHCPPLPSPTSQPQDRRPQDLCPWFPGP